MKKLLIVSSAAIITLTNSWSNSLGKNEIITFCKNSPKTTDSKYLNRAVSKMLAGEYKYTGGGSLILYPKGYYILKLLGGGSIGGCSKEQLSEVITNNNLDAKNFKLVKKYNTHKDNKDKSKQSDSIKIKTVQEVEVPISQDIKALLTLKMGDKDYLATLPVAIKIAIKYPDTNKTFTIVNSGKHTTYYFEKMPLNFEKKDIVELNDKINVFDINGDGLNEIFIYGSSYYGINGYVGKLAILSPRKNRDLKQLPDITTFNLAKIYYIKKENIIVVAQAIWGSKEQERHRDSHKYTIDVYEVDSFKKRTLFKTDKSFKDENGFSIESVIDKIHSKYKMRKQVKPHKKEIVNYNNEIQNYLKKELKSGYSHGDESQALEMDRAYFETVGSILQDYLKKNGFKFLKPDEYKKKIKQKLDLNQKEYMYRSSDDYIDTPAFPVGSDNLYLLPKQGIVSLPYKMPQVVDYKKDYPKLAEFEKSVNKNYKKSKNSQQRVSWSSVNPNVENNLKFTLALNKYLLNDDDTQISWLVENAYSTMLSLYKQGNRSDKKLLKALLKEYIKYKHKPMKGYEPITMTDLGDLLFISSRIGNKNIYKLDKKALKEIIKLSKKSNSNIYQKALKEYISKHKNNKSISKEIEKLKTFINLSHNKKGKKKIFTPPDRLYVPAPKKIGIKALEIGISAPKGRYITLYIDRKNLENLIKIKPEKFKDTSLILEVNAKEMAKNNFKFYKTKQGHFAIKTIPGKYLIVRGTNIIKQNKKAQPKVAKYIGKLIKNKNKIETDFRKFVGFKWSKVCFFDNSNIEMKFYNKKGDTPVTIELPKNYNIEEGYVSGTPIKEIYKNNKLSKKNCWRKGTKFIIKKLNTKEGNDLVVRVKE